MWFVSGISPSRTMITLCNENNDYNLIPVI